MKHIVLKSKLVSFDRGQNKECIILITIIIIIVIIIIITIRIHNSNNDNNIKKQNKKYLKKTNYSGDLYSAVSHHVSHTFLNQNQVSFDREQNTKNMTHTLDLCDSTSTKHRRTRAKTKRTAAFMVMVSVL